MKKIMICAFAALLGMNMLAQVTVTDEDGDVYKIDSPNIQTDEKGNVIIRDNEGNELIRVSQNSDTLPKADSAAVSLGKWKISVTEKTDGSDGVKMKVSKDEDEADGHTNADDHSVKGFDTEWGLLSVGYNTFLNADNSTTIAEPYSVLGDLKPWGSFDVNIDIFKSRINIAHGYLNFNYGIAIESHHFKFDDNFTILPNADSLTINTELTAYDKNKFNTTHICLPLSIGFETKPWDTDHSFRMQFGYDPGLLWYGKTKHKLDGKKDVTKDNFNLNQFRQEVNYEIGYGDFNVYASYDINGMFKDNEGPELHPFSVGLIFRKGF